MPTAPAKRRGPAKRLHLLRISCEHFLSKGYDGTSVDAIVAEAGGSKATIYSHFSSKEALFAACIGHLCDEFLARLQHIDIKAPATREDGLRLILAELVDVVASDRHVDFYRLVVAGRDIPGVGHAWLEHGPRVWHQLIGQLFQRHPLVPARGRGPDPAVLDEPTLAEILFDSMLSHLLIQTVILGRPVKAEAAAARIEAIIEATHHGLRA